MQRYSGMGAYAARHRPGGQPPHSDCLATAHGSPAGAAWPSLYSATSPQAQSCEFVGPAGRDQTSGTPKPVTLPRAPTIRRGRELWAASEQLTGVAFGIGADTAVQGLLPEP
ncbi:hypothetical protein [Streptomyces sp. R08]|uniref:Uncharacterized protein n=1 Tax=Streptomyces sp. R08 TaxID=3238624 RepID=A0AB39MM52_9ACTN